MKIWYTKTIFPREGAVQRLEYSPNRIEWCCDDALNAFRSKRLAFGTRRAAELSLAFPCGDDDHVYYEVIFCPWCGQKVECVQEFEIRMAKKVTTETREVVSYEPESPA